MGSETRTFVIQRRERATMNCRDQPEASPLSVFQPKQFQENRLQGKQFRERMIIRLLFFHARLRSGSQ